MVTAGQLLRADPGQMRYIAGVYRGAAASIATRRDELDRVTLGLAARWSGSAQASALAALAGVRNRLTDATLALTAADQALSEFAETVAVAQNGMSATLGGVGRALRMADAADADAARRLAAASGWFDAVVETAYVPPPDADPTAVSQWWARLSPGEQRYLIESRPRDVTNLDGVPADARDEAARLLLRTERASLTTLAADSSLPSETRRRVQAEIAGLDAVSAQLDDPFAASRSYLLGVDAADNRAIISVGDPDRATDVVTMVSGVGSGLDHIGPSLSAARDITAQSTSIAPAFRDVATVSWLDYQAPATLQQAASADPARDAAGDLARFDEGLRLTHLGRPAHDTLLGYSYGSTVVGMTAHSHTVTADDIVFVGSPGVGVDHAADLGVDPSHVWATTAGSDPIRLAIDPVARAEAAITGHSSSALWFGVDPDSPAFGGQRFDSDPSGSLESLAAHLSYFDEGTSSLENIADIAVGEPPSR